MKKEMINKQPKNKFIKAKNFSNTKLELNYLARISRILLFNFRVLKYQSAYAQNQFKEEICRYMDELAAKIGGQYEIFSTLQVSIAGDMDLVWR